MPRTVSKTVYQYDELSEPARAKAREWYASQVFGDSADWEHVYEDAVTQLACLGIDIDVDNHAASRAAAPGAQDETQTPRREEI